MVLVLTVVHCLTLTLQTDVWVSHNKPARTLHLVGDTQSLKVRELDQDYSDDGPDILSKKQEVQRQHNSPNNGDEIMKLVGLYMTAQHLEQESTFRYCFR